MARWGSPSKGKPVYNADGLEALLVASGAIRDVRLF
jgi:hypothetical protein